MLAPHPDKKSDKQSFLLVAFLDEIKQKSLIQFYSFL